MKRFAHTKWDVAPVLAAVAHVLFNVHLIVGFSGRTLWLPAVLGWEQDKAGVHVISTCRTLGFMANENRELESGHADR